MLIWTRWFLTSQFTLSVLTFLPEEVFLGILRWFLQKERRCPNQYKCKHLYPMIHRITYLLERSLSYSTSKNSSLLSLFRCAYLFWQTNIYQFLALGVVQVVHHFFKLCQILLKSISKLANVAMEDEVI